MSNISTGEIEIEKKPYRKLYKPYINQEEFNQLLEIFKTAIIKSEKIAINHFENDEEARFLYLQEMKYLEINYLDLLELNMINFSKHPIYCKFTIGIICLDEFLQCVFPYDSRGLCSIIFSVDFNLNISIVEIL